ncbi:uncharacterized protein N0V89_004064 [Didymosphaeria variabile]|uniref:Uncharacterized protein n=1 Tax=Didymosphaeria variabile TaxID=1932322 RepID=A0A9W9CD34_9PLEO|nr:uncharacterized protein N0V89_004064 [Didymosphaeria variabile]KAJ4356037.1 hypothetical protein N0V89_004064 [Didymosphaeria variabile]
MSLPAAPHCSTDTVFCVFHHFALPRGSTANSPAEIRTISLGIYSSFFTAQAAAVSALEHCLKQLQSAGITGQVSSSEKPLSAIDSIFLMIFTNSNSTISQFCKDIDLLRRGLITQITANGQERHLSEYEIRAVRLQDRGPENITIPGKKPNITTSLPPETKPITISDIEQDPLWAQSRIPYFRKRDDGPFRYKGDPSYMNSFLLFDQEFAARRQAWLRGFIGKGKDIRGTTEIAQRALEPDHTSKSRSVKKAEVKAQKFQPNEKADKMENGSWKLAGNGATRQRPGGEKDIGTIYRGRRHSISLD